MVRLFEDVSLDEITFVRNGTGLCLSLIDLDNGDPLAQIDCNGVCLFKYENTFESEDGLACYIGEVISSTIEGREKSKVLKRLLYGFKDARGKIYHPSRTAMCELHMEGGELCLSVVCRSIKVREM